MRIRPGALDDRAAIVAIHNHYVANSRATFDVEPVTVTDRTAWFEQFALTGPYRLLVADDGAVRGYACSIPYRAHPAFVETVEFSVYVEPGHTGGGVGTRLYDRLLEELRSENVHRVLAAIALPNDASLELHRRFGFEEVGVFDEYATKWGERVSLIWLQRRC